MEINKLKKNGGAAMVVLLFFFVVISTTILLGIVVPVVRELKISNDSLDSRKSYFMAESGMEDLMYRIKNNMEVGVLGDNRTLFLDEDYLPIPTILTNGLSGQKTIEIQGDIKDRQRSIAVNLTTSTGVAFNYGVLVGQGGITLSGSGTINGNVYANGPITGDSSSIITGTAISANSPSMGTSQSNGTGIPAYNISFGNNNATQDIGQSFKVSDENPVNKVQFYIKKVGTPSDATVKIVKDSSGKPGTTVLATGTLGASAVTTSYGWINVSFTTNPKLNPETTYWLVIDASTSSSKYYVIGASNGGYGNGLGKIGTSAGVWNSTTPAGLDYFFNIYTGGINGLIAGSSGSQWNQLHVGTVSGSAQAHTVNYTNATGSIYCESGTGNNKACLTQPDPVYIDFPVSDGNIENWKTDASSGGTYTGNYNVGWAGATLGPKKIVGNLEVSGGGTLTLTGNIWVTGNIVLSGGGKIKLASSYGTNDGVIISGGTVVVSGGGNATGSGTAGSYLMILSLDETTSAMTISGGAGAVIAYAPYGTIKISGGASLKEATGYKLLIEGGSTITYESGLSNNNFSSGPSGSWSINTWGESE
jgi:hypothetical protein